MRWIGVSVAALSFVFVAGAAIADHTGGAPGGGQGSGGSQGIGSGGQGSGTVRPRASIPGYRLVATNRCQQTISMAYRVKDYTGLWVTRGWFHIRPGQTRTLWMPTRNKVFYYYGYMENGSSKWDSKKADSRKRWVRTRPFLHASGRLSGTGVRQV
ncbi:MAG: DUF1036 domain-containing protein, partial [Alphaproteobacteria bacterium]